MEQAAPHHRDGRLEAGQGHGGGLLVVGDGVAHIGVGHRLDAGGDEAHLARVKSVDLDHLRGEVTHGIHLIGGAAGHHADLLAALQHAVLDANQDDDAQVGVVPGIHQQGLKLGLVVAFRAGQAGDQGFQHVVDADAGLGGNHHRFRRVQADDILDLLLDAFGFGGRQVDLVQDRHDLVAGVQRLIDVGERLGFHALRRVDHQDRALASGQRPADFIGEVHVAGGVHQVQLISLAILGLIGQAHGLRLDGDAAFAFDVHGIKNLILHLAQFDGAALLDQAVGKGGLAVVDVGDDGEVADMRELGHGLLMQGLVNRGNIGPYAAIWKGGWHPPFHQSSESGQHQLADGPSAFDSRVGASQGGGVDLA